MSTAPPDASGSAAGEAEAPAPRRRRRARKRRRSAPNRRRLIVVAGGLALLGAVAMGLRLTLGGSAATGSDDAVRRLDIQITWHAARPGARLFLATPLDTRFARRLGSRSTHPGMRLQRARPATGVRKLVAVAAGEGLAHLGAQFDMHLLAGGHAAIATSTEPGARGAARRAPASEPGIEISDEAVRRVLRALPAEHETGAADAEAIFRYLVAAIDDAPESGVDDAERVLSEGRGTALGQARTFAALARAAGLDARVVAGVLLEPPGAAAIHHWAEVFEAGAWRAFDPSHGHAGRVPPWYVPLRRGGSDVIRIEGGSLVAARYTVTREARPVAVPGAELSVATVLDLSRLSADTRDALGIVLLLPFGVLINLVFRSGFRLQTYGTFSGTLLALAASAGHWSTAVVMFVLVTGIAIAGRALMPGLGISRTPRLALVFVLVVISSVLVMSSLQSFGTGAVVAGVLLPMVVLTTLTDRVYSVADEQGLRVALERLAWTVLVAVLAFTVFLSDSLAQLMLRHPEAHLITAAAMLAVAAFGSRDQERPAMARG